MPSLSFAAFKIPQQKKKAPIPQLIYCKHILYNQTYVNTGILHPYIIAKHLISKTMCIDMLLPQPPDFPEDFPPDFGTWLQTCAPVMPQEHE